MLTRTWRALRRVLLTLLRAAFILMLLLIPVPVGALFHRLLEGRRKADAAQIKRD